MSAYILFFKKIRTPEMCLRLSLENDHVPPTHVSPSYDLLASCGQDWEDRLHYKCTEHLEGSQKEFSGFGNLNFLKSEKCLGLYFQAGTKIKE